MDPLLLLFLGVCGSGALVAAADHIDNNVILRAAIERLRELGFEIHVPKPFDPRLPVARNPKLLVRGRVMIRLRGALTGIRGAIDVDQVHASSRVTFQLQRRKAGFAVADGWPRARANTILERSEIRTGVSQVFQHRGVKRVVLAADAVVHDGGYLRAYFKVSMSNVGDIRAIADDLIKLADALDENRFVEPVEKEEPRLSLPPGATSGASGDPFVIPIR